MAVRLKRSFRAVGSDGRTYVINEWATLIPAGTLNDPHAVVEGLSMLMTGSGEHVNRVGDDMFQVVSTGVTLLPVDDSD